MNLTPGGLFGYCSSKCMTSRKVPSSKGVSAGPIMTAFLYDIDQYVPPPHLPALWGTPSYHVMTLSAIGDAETPAGGSVCILWLVC